MSGANLRRLGAALVVAMGVGGSVQGQSMAPGGMPPPDGMTLADSTAMRFPQSVRVGDLPGRTVLEPVGTQRVLGRVNQVVRAGDGTTQIVMSYGGFLGFGARLIAVPTDAMVLLGQDVEVVAYTLAQLDALPSYASGGTPLSPDDKIKMGLAKPSH